MRSTFSMLTIGCVVGHTALAGELGGSCSAGTCSQDEATLLQMQGLRHKFQAKMTTEVSVPNEGTQCWHSDQCGGQGGTCPQYCGSGVCCRAGWTALNDKEREDCGQNGWGILNHHTCQPARSTYVGCFVDDGSRDLEQGPRAYGYTRPTCATACAGYDYFALQHNGWCVCSNAYSTETQYHRAADSDCGGPCAGETEGRCGGGWRNAVYLTNAGAGAGPPGPEGPPGAPGATGPAGAQGATGAQGPPGATGAQGAQGLAGVPGPQGERGATGPQGPAGVAGPQGQRGAAGARGEVGQQGNQGATGPRGEPGVQGEPGPQGNAGARGETGAQGPQGAPGPQGERGERGERGVPGEAGPQGIPGDVGAPGAPGAVGIAGPQGPAGPPGPQGPAGADGVDGAPAPPLDPALEERLTNLEDLLSHGYSVDGCSRGNSNSNPDRGDQSGEFIPLMARDVADTAAVRCCSYDGSTCASSVQGTCHDSATFFEAQMICNEAGMRLCTAEEVDVCCNTGCWYNHFAVWIK